MHELQPDQYLVEVIKSGSGVNVIEHRQGYVMSESIETHYDSIAEAEESLIAEIDDKEKLANEIEGAKKLDKIGIGLFAAKLAVDSFNNNGQLGDVLDIGILAVFFGILYLANGRTETKRVLASKKRSAVHEARRLNIPQYHAVFDLNREGA